MATKGFTLASGRDVFSIETVEPSNSKSATKLSGKAAKDFYENVMKDDEGNGVSRCASAKRDDGREQQNVQRNILKSSRRARRRVGPAEMQRSRTDSAVRRSGQNESTQRSDTSDSNRSMELLGLRLLRCAHEGDTSGLKDLLSKGVDINFQDTFFWTAMMCASWTGQRAAVRLLLQHGAAWVGVVDTQGRDAKDLALEGGHTDVVEELESYGRSTRRDTDSDGSQCRGSAHLESLICLLKNVTQPQWCDVCRSTYTSSLSSHLSSTLHQFSVQHPPTTPYYCLPPSSKSYKMMVRCGWEPGTGLGPDGGGPKQPVPTVLKRDQKGLGYGQLKRAKVTHFQARDHDAVKLTSKEKERRGKGQRKEESRRKDQEDKNWERDFRVSFYL